MKNKNFFSISWPLVRECFRMYWYIPALSFVMYFFAGIFPMLSNIKSMPEIENYITDAFNNLNIIYIAILVITPIVSATIMMGFLHGEPKALMLHALPMSKNRLFNSYCLSGWLLCLIPVILMGLLYCGAAPQTEVIQLAAIFRWFIASASMITFFYGMAVLAASLTGTAYMNLIVTGIMLVIIPLIMLIVRIYCEIFIAGFYMLPYAVVDFCIKTNPILALMSYSEPLSVASGVNYLILGLVLTLAAKLIYKTRKLELVGNSMLSKVFEEICTYLTVFVGMSAFGLLAWNFTYQRIFIIVGMIFGTLFTFAITKIVLNRSVRIFNREFLRSLAIYLCIAAVFVSVTVFDILGIDTKVPDKEQVESVEMLDIVEGYDYYMRAYGDAGEEYVEQNPVLTSPEAIELTLQLHRYIIENGITVAESYFYEETADTVLTDAWGNENCVYNEYINIRYNLKNGQKLMRRYDLVLDDEVVEILNRLLTCEEYVEKSKITSYINTDKISYMTVTSSDASAEEGLAEPAYDYENGDMAEATQTSMVIVDDKDEILRILKSWEEDIARGGYKVSNRNISRFYWLGRIEIYFEKSKKAVGDAAGSSYGNAADTGADNSGASAGAGNSGAGGASGAGAEGAASGITAGESPVGGTGAYEISGDNPYVGFDFTSMDYSLIGYLKSAGHIR